MLAVHAAAITPSANSAHGSMVRLEGVVLIADATRFAMASGR
jgi:hypothetical protein